MRRELNILRDDVRRKGLLKKFILEVYKKKKSELTPLVITGLLTATWYNRAAHNKNSSAFMRGLELLGLPMDDSSINGLRGLGNGFTAFYNSFRPSVESWVEQNFREIREILHLVVTAEDESALISLAERIEALPDIKGKGKASERGMKAESLLTPLVFCLDSQNRFPVVNKRNVVQKFLASISTGETLATKVADSIAYQRANQYTAVDLDCLDEKSIFNKKAGKGRNRRSSRLDGDWLKLRDRDLKLKDESDIERPHQEAIKVRRAHNEMLNRLASYERNGFYLREGTSVPYDLLVIDSRQNQKRLLVEVKSSLSQADIRQAIGQLFHYEYLLNKRERCEINYQKAVLLPEKPSADDLKFLFDTGFSIIWESSSGGYGAKFQSEAHSFSRAFELNR